MTHIVQNVNFFHISGLAKKKSLCVARPTVRQKVFFDIIKDSRLSCDLGGR